MAAAEISTDYSATFSKVRSELRNSKGTLYTDFIATLKPNYAMVCRDITLGYVMLFAGALVPGILIGPETPLLLSLLGIALGVVWVGYWLAFIQLFIHEAAHYNIAKDRQTNDRLANIFLGSLIGSSIADYRKVHFKHHGSLGTVHDSENSYFFPVNLTFLFKMLTGLRVLEVIFNRRAIVAKKSKSKRGMQTAFILGGALFHLTMTVILFLLVGLEAAAIWVVGVTIMFPFFGAIRQVLEHRSEEADPGVDYREVDHGAYTRMFPKDLFSSTFGGAGFNRHLLHHWEPNVSYTNYDEFEAFLNDTEMRPIIEARRATYFGALRNLFVNGTPKQHALHASSTRAD